MLAAVGPLQNQRHGQPRQRQVTQFLELFMTAASLGVISMTMINGYYPTYEDHMLAVAEKIRLDYELIVSRGMVLQ